LDTSARAYLEENKEDNPEFLAEKAIATLDNEELLDAVKVSRDSIDGVGMYKLTFIPDDEMVDKFFDSVTASAYGTQIPTSGSGAIKASESFKNIKAEIWINRKTYFTQKVTLAMDTVSQSSVGLPLNPTSIVAEPTEVSLVLSGEFADFGKEFTFQTPSGAVTLDEFVLRAQEIYQTSLESAAEEATSSTPAPTSPPTSTPTSPSVPAATPISELTPTI
jgi:hypothetical protein